MTKAQRHPLSADYRRLTIAGLAFALMAILTGLAFGGWMENGARILAVMAESGLSWCL
ncbi:hypothetical protein [Pseudohoeflea suaedae]|uniref:hypothetical protein n=1 Tax=Pseudohoeflea suaedae TaxID=877384 RepID=UPI0015756B8B|nr:hypothetical protein [Pseudohoeflea suaedae]